MTYDEVKTRITALVGNPDTAQESAVTLLSDLEKDYTTLDSMTSKVSESEKRIRDLQDTNQRLFLSVTGQPAEEEEKEDDPIDWDSLATEEKE